MKRLIGSYLQKWKERPNRKSLLLRGARQVGKTYSVRELGQSFDEFIEINLELNPEYTDIFLPNLDPNRILRELRLVTGKRLIPGYSLLFIDEIQQAPEAISAMRYFYEKIPDLHVIGAGSLLEFALEQVGIPVGRVASLYMYPMSFLEYLVASGEKAAAEYILDDKALLDISPAIHAKLLRRVGEYFGLGGLPEVISTWLEHEDLMRCGDILDVLVSAYRQDFAKYAKRHQIRYVDLVFNEIPALTGEKFKFNALPGHWKARELAPALELLCKAAVAYTIRHSAGNGLPLKAESNPRKFKTMLFDIGLAQRLMGARVEQWLLKPEVSLRNCGPMTEAFVGQEYLAYSRPWSPQDLYYWHREARSSNAEVDYLFPLDNTVIPIEVKSGVSGKLRSLRIFLEQEKPSTPFGIRFCEQPASLYNDLHTYALYAVAHVLRNQVPTDWME